MNVMSWFRNIMRGKSGNADSLESKQKCHSGRSYGRRRSMCTCELQEQRKTLEKEREIAGEAMERLVK